MKKKFNFVWRVAIALVLVFSLGMVVNSPAPTSANAVEPLVVTITSPDSIDTFEVSDTFNVVATIENTSGATVSDVSATISWIGSASLVGGDTDTKALGDIPPGATQEAQWTLHCDGAGDLTITVTESIAGTYGVVTVQQLGAPQITTVILEPAPMTKVGVSDPDNFTVRATLTNDGHEPLDSVSASISIPEGRASVVSGPTYGSWPNSDGYLDKGESVEVTWTVHCDDADPITNKPDADDPRTWAVDYTDITVTGYGTGTSTNTPVNHAASTSVYQKYLIVEIVTAPEQLPVPERINVSREFYVFAQVTNYHTQAIQAGGSAEVFWSPTGDLELYAGPPAMQALPTIDPGETVTVPMSWHFHCLATGTVTIDVVASVITVTSITLQNWDSITVIQQEPAALRAVITTPQTSDSFYISQNFPITATIYNDGDETAENVDVVLGIVGSANEVTGVVWTWPTAVSGVIPGGGSATVSWEYHCNGPGDVTITVTPSGTGANTGDDILATSDGYTDPIADSETVHQLPLEVVITTPTENPTYATSQTFSVEARLTNLSSTEDVGEVTATLVISDHASIVAGESESKVITQVLADDTQWVTWTVHCDGPGEVSFTVEAATTWYGNPVTVVSDPETVQQEAPPLEVEILSPGGTTFELQTSGDGDATWSTTEAYSGQQSILLSSGSDFNSSLGRAVIGENMLLSSINTISFRYLLNSQVQVPALLSPTSIYRQQGQSYSDNDGYMSPYLVLAIDTNADGSADAWVISQQFGRDPDAPYTPVWELWDLNKNAPFDGTHDPTVALWHDHLYTDNGATGGSGTWPAGWEPLSWFQNTQYPGAVVVAVKVAIGEWAITEEQSAYIDEVMVNGVAYPMKLDTYVGTSSDFAVTARVTNVGPTMATNIPVTIDPGAKASVMSPAATQTVDIPYGESVVLTWTLHCDAQGTDTITVSAVGLTTVTDTVTITQYPKAHLEVNITQFPPAPIDVSSNFIVGAYITNTGEADAWEVTATLSVFPEESAKVTDGGYTKTVGTGTLVGHGENTPVYVEWELHCKLPSESTITITAAGYDEFGWHLKQDPQTGETILVAMPGRAIDERNIEPDSDTVRQLERVSVDLAVTKAVDETRPMVGAGVEFTITVTNNGPDAATGVQIDDLLDVNLTHTGHSASLGGYNHLTGVWDVGGLGVGMTATLLLRATVGDAGEILNTAAVGADQSDWNSLNDQASVTLNQAAVTQWSIGLAEGWNLISLPLIPTNQAIATILTGIEGNINTTFGVSAYDAETPVWSSNVPLAWAGDLTEMRDGPGFWIVMDASDTLTVTGVEVRLPPATPPTYKVFEGWNLIGFKSVTPRTAGDYLAAIAGKYTMIYRFTGGVFSVVLAGDNMMPGQGFWIAITEPEPTGGWTIYP